MMDEQLQQTERGLLESHYFRSKPQMQRLLKYLIRYSYENNEEALQQKAIATECLGRADDFIPSQDPIVRIEAARLRKLLDSFYDDAQQKLPYRVSLPKGSYRLHFARHGESSVSSGLGLLLVCQTTEQAPAEALQLMLKVKSELADRFSCFNHVELTVEHLPKNQISQKGSVHFLAQKQHDYVLRIEVISDGKGDCLVSSVVIHGASQEILWSHSTLVVMDACDRSLEVLYKNLVRSLVADSFGLLGNHWSNFNKRKASEDIPDHKKSWVHLIGFIDKPSVELARDYLNFLKKRLKKCPHDHVAYAGYLCLVLYDFNYRFGLFDSSLDERWEQLVVAAREYPTYYAFTVLLGLYCFVSKRYDDAKVYLETGLALSPYNSAIGFVYGGVLFFAGEQERGMEVINDVTKDFHSSNTMPSFYLLLEFLYRLEQGDPSKAYQLGIRLGFDTEQLKDIGALKGHPDLFNYCFKVFETSVLESK